ncbi:unnamed protein product [Staurois parvus]|uniref:Uncharacterized protein n=1 Tax=Staurois parvus TaxID=386267 RepID=A0ABN9DKZ9_9NEOB|nr:unnamed protein product [Staurois parvus]
MEFCFVSLCCAKFKGTKMQYNTCTQHTRHTVNPFLSPQMLSPSCPVSLVQCHCFLLALITVLVSLGMSVAVSQFPPSITMPIAVWPISC